jgi:ketosteroid isomerase-like protein
MKKIIRLLLSAMLLASCQSGKQEADNIAKAKEMFDAFNRHEWAVMTRFYSEPASFLDPSYGVEYVDKTRNEIAGKYSGMQKIFPDIHDELIGIYASDDKVTVEFVSTGTAADGSKFRLPIISVLTFKDGAIVRDATYYDNP